jgi:U1 small nuclear ribonucleoprotein C
MKKTLLSALTCFLLLGCGVGTEGDVATDDSSLTSSEDGLSTAPGGGFRHLPPCPPGLVAVRLLVCPPPPPPGTQPAVRDGGVLPPPFHPCFIPPPLPPRCEGPAGGFDGGLPPFPGAGGPIGPGAPLPPPLFVCLPPLPQP